MLLAAFRGVKAVFTVSSGCRGAGNGATACILAGCTWPATVRHDHGPRGTSATLVAEGEGDIGARGHSIWLVGDVVAVSGGADKQPRSVIEHPDWQVIGIEFVVVVAVDVEQITIFPGRTRDAVIATGAAICARAKCRPFTAFDRLTACQMQGGDKRVDRARHTLAEEELLNGWNRNGGNCADDG